MFSSHKISLRLILVFLVLGFVALSNEAKSQEEFEVQENIVATIDRPVKITETNLLSPEEMAAVAYRLVPKRLEGCWKELVDYYALFKSTNWMEATALERRVNKNMFEFDCNRQLNAYFEVEKTQNDEMIIRVKYQDEKGTQENINASVREEIRKISATKVLLDTETLLNIIRY